MSIADPGLVIRSPNAAFNAFFREGGIRRGDSVLIAAPACSFQTRLLINAAMWVTPSSTDTPEKIAVVPDDAEVSALAQQWATTHRLDIYRHYADRSLMPEFTPLGDLQHALQNGSTSASRTKAVLIDNSAVESKGDVADIFRHATDQTYAAVLFNRLLRSGVSKIDEQRYSDLTTLDVYNKRAAEIADFVIVMYLHRPAHPAVLSPTGLRLQLIKRRGMILNPGKYPICDFAIDTKGVLTPYNGDPE